MASLTNTVPKSQSIYSCVFPLCGFKGSKGLFTFPKDPLVRIKWLNACGLESVSSNSKVCFHHFHPTEIFKGEKLWRLRSTAIPNLGNVSSSIVCVIILEALIILYIPIAGSVLCSKRISL